MVSCQMLLFLQGVKFSALCFTNKVIICWIKKTKQTNKKNPDQSPLHAVLLSGVKLICMFPKVRHTILSTMKAKKEYYYPGDYNKKTNPQLWNYFLPGAVLGREK